MLLCICATLAVVGARPDLVVAGAEKLSEKVWRALSGGRWMGRRCGCVGERGCVGVGCESGRWSVVVLGSEVL